LGQDDPSLRERGSAPPAARTDAGYRQYAEKDVHTLQFIRRSRDLGFSIEEIRGLLSLWQDRRRPSRQVNAMAQAHIADLEQKAQEILAMKSTLEHLVHCCKWDDRPDYPILENLADHGHDSPPAATRPRAKHGFAQR
jgi:DNA-binding transcriptional MerR regulator